MKNLTLTVQQLINLVDSELLKLSYDDLTEIWMIADIPYISSLYRFRTLARDRSREDRMNWTAQLRHNRPVEEQ